MPTVTFFINDKPVTADYEGRETLLKYLRNVECMKGTKEACSTGHCGACSVIVDGKLRRSCVTLLRTLDGKHVETIESEGTPDALSVIQQAFLDAGAVQCGFCIPGMIMATRALLLEKPNPTEEEIFAGLKNNYCRCTGYVKIIEAVKLAAGRMRGEELTEEDVREHESSTIVIGKDQVVEPIGGRFVGRRLNCVDGPEKVCGTLPFCDDYEADEFGAAQMLHGAFVWSPAPHAKILSVDYREVEEAKGVVRVVTAKDVPGLNKFGAWTPDQPVFCEDETNFLGDYLALVVADTEEHARAAAALAKIDYRELPGLYDIADSVAEDSYIVTTSRINGDIRAAKARRDVVKVRVSKEIEPQDHICMEPFSAIGAFDGEQMTVYACTQAPFEVRTCLAKNLEMPEEKIRVVATSLGGGFGKKCDMVLESPVAVAALVCRAPVKVTLTRAEDLVATTKRHGYHTDYEIGFLPDGKFHYLEARMFSDGGPYECESYGTLMTGALMSGGPYIIPHVDVDARCARNNALLGGAFRGYGINQAAISIETAMDEMAEKLGISPFELRRRNAVYPGSYSVGGELLEDSMAMLDTIDLCEKRLLEVLPEYEKQYPNGTKVLGWGMASGFKNSGVGKGIFVDDGACRLTLCANGRLEMLVSGTDMGQGFRTAMVQIAAEVLDMDPARIDIAIGDTARTIPTGESVAERQTLCDGRAVYEASVKLKEALRENPWKAGEERKAEYYFRAPECVPIGAFDVAKEKGIRYRNFPAYAYATQAAIVEVDTATGVVRLLKVIAAHDVGRAINPKIIEGQMQGSCHQGQGYALTEGYPTVNGYPVKKTYKELGVPGIADTPDYDLILIEDPCAIGPYGAKGISEVATVPVTPAILNAIYNAIGVRINKVPASPEVILEAIRTGRCKVPTMDEMVQQRGKRMVAEQAG